MYPPRNKNQITLNSSPKAIDKKNSLISKITELLKIKHEEIFNQIKYDMSNLREDLNIYLTEKVLQNFSYTKFIAHVEKEILKKYNLQNEQKILNPVGSTVDETATNNNNLKIIENEENAENAKIPNTKLNNSIPTQINTHTFVDTKDPNIKNNLTLFQPSDSPILDKNSKLENLKNIKEKDEWAIMAKKNYEKHLEEMKIKKLKQNSVEKNVKETLLNQVEERKSSKEKNKEKEKEYLNFISRDHDTWLKNEELKNFEKINKLKTLEDSRKNFSLSN
jgi:hypothetical protein